MVRCVPFQRPNTAIGLPPLRASKERYQVVSPSGLVGKQSPWELRRWVICHRPVSSVSQMGVTSWMSMGKSSSQGLRLRESA